jgi:hypothetical protein
MARRANPHPRLPASQCDIAKEMKRIDEAILRTKRTASGELSRSDFVAFLKSTLAQAAAVSRDGAVHYVCMDWRRIGELVEAGSPHYLYSSRVVITHLMQSAALRGRNSTAKAH